MAFRGGPPSSQMPPSLMQMAQGVVPQGGGDSGGDLGILGQVGRGGGDFAFGNDPILNNALSSGQWRPITSPEDQNYSDYQGNPIHLGGPAPAYTPGTTQGGFNSIFDRRAPSSTGGYFTMKDYLKGDPNPEGARTYGWSPGSENSLSTNNWRLLGNDPDMFMYNGQVIDRRLLQYMMTPLSVMADEGVNPPGMNPAGPPGSGVWARKMGSYGGTMGYPGNSNWPIVATPTY